MINKKIKRRDFIRTTGTGALALNLPVTGLLSCRGKKEKPNILWITCEDISPHPGCYGDKYARTPNLDKFAPVCTPARSSIITGVFAWSQGTQHLRGEMPLSPSLRCFPGYLREAGYYCTNNEKEDYNFETPETAWDDSSDTAHWRNRQEGQPFFSVFFYSDHGDGLPRGKRWIHDTGTKVPMMVRFPEKYRHLAPSGPGSRRKEMASFIDLAPTVLGLLSLSVPDYMQGHELFAENPEFLSPPAPDAGQLVFGKNAHPEGVAQTRICGGTER